MNGFCPCLSLMSMETEWVIGATEQKGTPHLGCMKSKMNDPSDCNVNGIFVIF